MSHYRVHKYLRKILSESAAYKLPYSLNPTTNLENMNSNFHIFFDQIEQVLLVLLVYLLSFISSEIIRLVKKVVSIHDL